jgi:hypothetical protein
VSKNDDDHDSSSQPRPLAHPPKLPDPGRYDGPARAAPYALSRMAPSFSLVDVASEIEKADSMLATVTGGKLGVIAEQIRRLQDQARVMLERAQRDAELHRARCSFEKKPGGVYHLYRKDDGERWFSLLAPEEWITAQPQTFEGSYRLEADMSFSRVDVLEDEPRADLEAVRALLAGRPR